MAVNILALPPELLLRILYFLPEVGELPFEDGPNFGFGYLIAAHVCTAWRALALSSGRSLEVITSRMPDVKQALAVFPNMPLSVRANSLDWCYNQRPMDHLLETSADRIVRLSINADPDEWMLLMGRPQTSLLKRLGDLPVPRLSKLSVSSHSLIGKENSHHIVAIILPKTARNSLRDVRLFNCAFNPHSNITDYALEHLTLDNCAMAWDLTFPGDVVRLDTLREMIVSGGTMLGIQRSARLDLRALESLRIEGKMDDILAALDRFIMPPSVHLEIECHTLKDALPTGPCPLLIPLSAHFAPARASGDWFTKVFVHNRPSPSVDIMCGAPNASAVVLASHTLFNISLVYHLSDEPNLFPSVPSPAPPRIFTQYVTELMGVFPLSAGGNTCSERRVEQKLTVQGTSNLWLRPYEWPAFGASLRTITSLSIELSAAHRLSRYLRDAEETRAAPAWPFLHELEVFQIDFQNGGRHFARFHYKVAGKVQDGEQRARRGVTQKQDKLHWMRFLNKQFPGDSFYTQQLAEGLFALLRQDSGLRIERFDKWGDFVFVRPV